MTRLLISTLSRGQKARFPASVSPMLCTLTRELVTAEDYFHEIKFDGYRIIGFKHKNKIKLASRSGLDYTHRYPAVVDAFGELAADFVVDGEVCALNSKGLPDFD